MNILKLQKREYTSFTTPIEYLENFSKALAGPHVYAKRDDLLGLTFGGNKTRKLEFLMADAIEKGADTIITCGAVQSNHCRLTLAAAVKEGLKCVLVLEERVSNSYNPNASGNNFLFHLLGAENIKVVPGGSNMLEEMEAVANELKNEGRNPYIIPGGGSNEIGAVGYAGCAQEILEQAKAMDVNIDYIVVASGSGGTHAGFLAGMLREGSDIPVLGISVSRPKETQEELIQDLLERTVKYLDINKEIPANFVICYDEYVGPGYSLPTDEMVEAVQLLARTEGILLDPVYTGKVMAGLVDLSRQGFFSKNDNVLFIHTGGAPALYVDPAVVLKEKEE